MIFQKNYFLNTTKELDVLSIIHETNRTIKDSEINEGLATIVVPGPGGALAIVEPLPEIIEQLKEAVRVFPGEGLETKNRRKEAINIGPRVVAAMLGKSLQLPVKAGKLVLGSREEIVLLDLEDTARRREFVVQIMGDTAPCENAPKGQKKR